MINWKKKIVGYKPGFVEIGNIWSIENNLSLLVNDICDLIKDVNFDTIATIETKGIIYAAPVAAKLSKPLIVFRKKDKIIHTDQKYRIYFKNWKDEDDGLEIEKRDLVDAKSIIVIDDLTEKLNSFKSVYEIVKQTKSNIVSFVTFINLSNQDELYGISIKSILKAPEYGI